MSLQTTLKTVFGGSRTGVFEDRVPDGRSASENALLSFVICVIRGAESALWWGLVLMRIIIKNR